MNKTVADLKRALTVGTKVTLTTFAYTKDGVTSPAPHKYLNIQRVVSTVQSKQFALKPVECGGWGDGSWGGESWQDIPKAAELTWHTDNVFTIDAGWVVTTYRID
jgi:hypothetical protein